MCHGVCGREGHYYIFMHELEENEGVGAVVLLMITIIVITCIGKKGRKRNKKCKQLNY